MIDSLHVVFPGSVASGYTDLVLLLETALGLALLGGAVLAHQGRFQAHAWCQSIVVLLNTAIVVVWMAPSFELQVVPKILTKLGKPFYGLAAAHAALGSVAEVLALYILLAAGTSVLPRQLRLTKYKAWMRTALVLWWVVILLGWMTYFRWYVPQSGRKPVPFQRSLFDGCRFSRAPTPTDSRCWTPS